MTINPVMNLALASSAEILQELGGRLREQRLAQGLKQSDLAAMAGVSPGAIKKLEQTGVSTLETVVRVVQALGLCSHLDGLFLLPRQSIAQMALAEKARRQRAPRSRKPAGEVR